MRQNEPSTKLKFDEADVDTISEQLAGAIKNQCDVARQELAIQSKPNQLGQTLFSQNKVDSSHEVFQTNFCLLKEEYETW
jgi:hypothetical protein